MAQGGARVETNPAGPTHLAHLLACVDALDQEVSATLRMIEQELYSRPSIAAASLKEAVVITEAGHPHGPPHGPAHGPCPSARDKTGAGHGAAGADGPPAGSCVCPDLTSLTAVTDFSIATLGCILPQ